MDGTIKTLTDKGFGFITVEGDDKDIFFHSSSLIDVTFDELNQGDAVTFDTEDSDKGPRAVNVALAPASDDAASDDDNSDDDSNDEDAE